MKTRAQNFFLGLGCAAFLSQAASAQTFTNLHSFANGSDGGRPWAGMILSGNTLYGTTREGGSWLYGTVFEINTDGSGLETLHSFTGGPGGPDGACLFAGLVLWGNALYGTTYEGGSSGYGTVFAMNLAASLNIHLTDNQVVLSWPAWAPGYRLQCTTNLGSRAAWRAVSSAPVTVNGRKVVTTAISGAQEQFRLALP
jgi:uncharacterized repeat protein (TIGR03803 family)